MPSSVYTLELWALSNAGGASPVIGPTPPAGFVWVVRDVVLHFPANSGYYPVVNQAILLAAGIPLAATPPTRTFRNVVYRFGDVRQTVNSGDLLELQAFVQGWNLRVTGYQLSTS